MKIYQYTCLILLITWCTTAKAQLPAAPPPQKDFSVKGFHLDLRIQTMPMPALKALARDLHQQGINTLIMEWEASYPFEQDPQIPNRYAYSRVQVRDFIAYCRQLGIDVIPLQQSFWSCRIYLEEQ